MRCHKKTKESGFFEGYSSDTDGSSMGKALKRTKICNTTSSESKRKVEYTQEELDTHIRKSESKGRHKNKNHFRNMYTYHYLWSLCAEFKYLVPSL